MRFVKLFICFAVFLAVIVAVVYFSKGVGTKGLNGVDNEYVQEYDSIIAVQWGEDAVWSSENFEDFKSELNAMKGEFGNGYKTLVNTLERLALDRLYEATIAEYHKPECEKKRIKELTADLDKYFPSEDNATVKELHDLNKLYERALKMCNVFSKRTQYNKNAIHKDSMWADFNKFKDGKIKERQSIMNDDLFHHISNIEKIKFNFSDVEFKNKLAYADSIFKDKLSLDIYNSFKADVPKLEDIETRYVDNINDLEDVNRDRQDVQNIKEHLRRVCDVFNEKFGEDPRPVVINLSNKLDAVLNKYDIIIRKSEEYINSQN